MPDRDANHLIHETSPYLLQHAHNPVDWHPWGEEAFALARAEDKPILLSIGYSTCHWCHVMEEESFSDPEVSRALNATFVAIKVDREERPDIDAVYMQAAQMLTGAGGWPLNVLLTPEGKPFYAFTYLPKHARFGRPGLLELTARVRELWRRDRSRLLRSAEQLADALRDVNAGSEADREAEGAAKQPSVDVVRQARDELARSFDAVHGGFGDAPKFPSPHKLLFLLRWQAEHHDAEALEMARRTLAAMRAGGIHDQLGGGFHRYATDARWLLPHFEKMLPDQAMLLMAFAEAFHATGEAAMAETARDVAGFVLREMRDARGGFHSALDADSEGGEGRFYMWTMAELEQALGREDAAFAARVFGVTTEGNVAEEATGRKTGANVLYLAHPPADEAGRKRLAGIRKRLLAAREQRPRPFRDDKVLTDWNGLMIAALARAARTLDEPAWANAAARAADFVLGNLRDADGRLLHRWRAGQAGIPGMLDDYAFLIWGLIELYETDFDARWLDAAVTLARRMDADFSAANGAFYAARAASRLPARPVEAFDGAQPSGNSAAMMDLLRLARLTGDAAWERRASRVASAFAERMAAMPSAFAWLAAGLLFAESPGYEIVLAGPREGAEADAMLAAVRAPYLPHAVVLWRDAASERLAPYARAQKPLNGRVTAYICRDFQCNQPTTDPAEVRRLLKSPAP